MRYLGDFKSNFSNAIGSKDEKLTRDLLLDKYSYLIRNYPTEVAQALVDSGEKVSNPNDKKELIKKVSKAIVNNRQFQKAISVLVVKYSTPKIQPYANYSDNPDAKGSTFADSIMGLFANKGGEGKAVAEGLANTGKRTAEGAGGGGVWGGIVGAVAGVTESVFSWKSSQERRKATEIQAKSAMYEKVFGKNEKSNKWILPTVIVGGVLIIGGIVVYLTLRNKK
jgi:hypothetical protein